MTPRPTPRVWRHTDRDGRGRVWQARTPGRGDAFRILTTTPYTTGSYGLLGPTGQEVNTQASDAFRQRGRTLQASDRRCAGARRHRERDPEQARHGGTWPPGR